MSFDDVKHVVDLITKLSNEERLQLFKIIAKSYCRNCGKVSFPEFGTCSCLNLK